VGSIRIQHPASGVLDSDGGILRKLV